MIVSDAVAAALEIDCSGAAVSALTPEMAMRPAPNLQLTHQYTGDDSLADSEPLANTNPRLSISPGMRPDGWGFGWIPPSHLETGAGASALPASLRRVVSRREAERGGPEYPRQRSVGRAGRCGDAAALAGGKERERDRYISKGR